MPFKIIRNDITTMTVDAIVNTANPRPIIGGGVDYAIHHAAGHELLKARLEIGSIPVGEAFITDAYKLPAKHVIHTVGPVWQGGSNHEIPSQCLLNGENQGVHLSKRQVTAIEDSIYETALTAATYGIHLEPEINHVIATAMTLDGMADKLEYILCLDACQCSGGSMISTWERNFLDSEILDSLQKCNRAALAMVRNGTAKIWSKLRDMAETLDDLVESSDEVEEQLQSNLEFIQADEHRQKTKERMRQGYLDNYLACKEQLESIRQPYRAEDIDDRLNATIECSLSFEI